MQKLLAGSFILTLKGKSILVLPQGRVGDCKKGLSRESVITNLQVPEDTKNMPGQSQS